MRTSARTRLKANRRCLRRWTAPVALTLMIACGSPLSAPDCAAQETAIVDSLVYYIETLEADLKLFQIEAKQEKETLLIKLEFMGKRLEWAEEDRLRWYQKPALWFMIGASLGLLAAGMALQVSI